MVTDTQFTTPLDAAAELDELAMHLFCTTYGLSLEQTYVEAEKQYPELAAFAARWDDDVAPPRRCTTQFAADDVCGTYTPFGRCPACGGTTVVVEEPAETELVGTAGEDLVWS